MNKTRSGFTLMEIMVVIIVIAVLASVAGPMIGSITDQGRSSATKSKLSSLKSALVSYKNDVGRFPYMGNAVNDVSDGAKYNQAHNAYLASAENNVLITNATAVPITNYDRRWKGPYMDSNAEDFMTDGWGNRIGYFAHDFNIYIRSDGINGIAEGVADALNAAKQESGEADDIITSVAKVRRKFNP